MSPLGNVHYPKAFNGKYIRTHWDFEDDLKDILERSGQKGAFWPKYKQRLRFLDERKHECVLKSDWFEKLRYDSDLYSLKFKDEKNIRILFAFVAYEGIEYAILLYPFQERNKKNGSQYSYETAKPIAKARLKEVIKGD